MTGSSREVRVGSTYPEYCLTLSFESIVNSPDPLVVQKIKVHDPSAVELMQSQGTEVVALTFDGEILDGLVHYGDRL